jgi:ATP-dependent DNA helicase RecQ
MLKVTTTGKPTGKFRYFRVMNLKGTLKDFFGFEEFRPGQEEIVNTVLSGKDCLVLMPTGGGKSICYQLPALMMDGITIVLSPLIALMKDQVDALRLNGVKAAFLNSSLDSHAQNKLMDDLQNERIKILYIAPERLNSSISSFLSFLKKIKVSLFAIDEAHCISHWGHDFRPDYLQLSLLKTSFPDVPIIALTATADKLTRTDILNKLNLKNPTVFVSSFNRQNIRYLVEEKNDYFNRMLDFLSQNKNESGIIYCLSRMQTDDLAEKLSDAGYPAMAYHAGLDQKTRTERQEKFKRDEVKIIVATIAFGMGIDKSNVRYVIHATLPKNIESYYQETGRAGRDGLPATALLFHSYGDLLKLKNFTTVENNKEQSDILAKKLEQLNTFCTSTACRRKYLLNYFDEEFQPPCNNCDICLGKSSLAGIFDGTVIAQKALSAIMRLKNSFGMTYVINVLKGSDSAKIRDEHRLLPTFGKGSEFSADQWKFYFRQIIENGYAEQYGEFNILRVTDSGRQVLYHDAKVMLREMPVKKALRAERIRTYADNAVIPEVDQELFEELRKLRLILAQAENVPPYVIFTDVTLTQLASELPATKEDLKYIAGFGKIKVIRYGEEFLSAIHSYCKRKGIEPKSLAVPPKKKTLHTDKSDTKMQSFELFMQGFNVNEISEKRNLSENTIFTHLLHFVETGKLNVLKFVSKEKLSRIKEMIDHHGEHKLTILKDALGDDYTYNEIKAVIAYARRPIAVSG